MQPFFAAGAKLELGIFLGDAVGVDNGIGRVEVAAGEKRWIEGRCSGGRWSGRKAPIEGVKVGIDRLGVVKGTENGKEIGSVGGGDKAFVRFGLGAMKDRWPFGRSWNVSAVTSFFRVMDFTLSRTLFDGVLDLSLTLGGCKVASVVTDG